MVNALTVDVEDYFQVSAFEDVVKRSDWDHQESRVCQNTYRILDLFDEYEAQGTFFVLGWVAEKFPKLVTEISTRGHEIGCHTYWHRLIYNMTPDEFREDLRQATQTIEDILGKKVDSFRAPSFSIIERSLWALDVLLEQGYRYDSSIFPIRHDKYGMPDTDRFPHTLRRTQGEIKEFPLTTRRIGKCHIPIAGGGYFRLYPASLSLKWLRAVNKKEKQPFVFYLHPWEIDPDQPRFAASLRSRFRHYQNLSRTERKLKQLLSTFQFQTMKDSFEANCNGRVGSSWESSHELYSVGRRIETILLWKEQRGKKNE